MLLSIKKLFFSYEERNKFRPYKAFIISQDYFQVQKINLFSSNLACRNILNLFLLGPLQAIIPIHKATYERIGEAKPTIGTHLFAAKAQHKITIGGM